MQYVPFASDIEIPFYASLASHKINHDKLDDSARKLLGLYEIRPADNKEHSCRMQIHANALTNDEVPAGSYRAEGMIKNVNTIEEYRNIDKLAMIQQAGKTIWDAINDGTIYSCPSLLASFLVLSFADLKKYKFNYWFAFPALVMDPPWVPMTSGGSLASPETDISYRKLTSIESTTLVDRVQTWKYAVDPRQHGFFLVKKVRDASFGHNSNNGGGGEEEFGPTSPQSPPTPTASLGFTWQVSSLSGFDTGFFDGGDPEDSFVAFADPSNYAEPGPVAPGWMLRNLLVLVRQRWKLDKVQVLCYRETQMRRDAARSVIFNMEISKQPSKQSSNAGDAARPPDYSQTMPKVVGWERNALNKLTGRMADLTEYMDPTKLADSSVDLNLKLMKWRISPNLNLEKIKETKCLLLGAGTLGSYVSRNLMGWGVRHITFVDNGSVSFSNPVRQPLFTFQDCLEGGKKKATAAAEALKTVYPGVQSKGYVLSVPMAGHPITDPEKTKAEYDTLEALVDDHDVIFLLMDTRESRWLPTVMGKAKGKIVMNAALGFDTYVVMRHGVRPEPPLPGTQREEAEKQTQNQGQGKGELGCYFCNDVVAPADSMKDLTLDQQCTVTRPGVAAIASALLAELFVSVLQHPRGAAAPASLSSADRTGDRGGDQNHDHPLGLVPHTIRGFLATFSNMAITGTAYKHCSACSDKVLDAYEAGGWGFVQRALNEKGFVEEISGLKEVQRLAEEAARDIEFSEEDEGVEDEEGELI
ncbi:E1-like protein-activating enzyme Gsa7p/Apg7p [Cladophialophora bantiana CBS 173.52]|uniref:Ubiquitin-like modifier-activating enzyme ATG7 n=1 Tax=Cladophialophora bantiana (strain ATCC 10958 / CBS 173.52 / CDC B-1940 / NIH 8579) TaxID=1442370 RepID=A0A0D2GLG0_CLAB1|nr:E1-like protein-activating enzyme Gsa7p/Apg7p [Cladophialophora bantiana CBS 173.52]KIW99222.1 E1-like protein-activating enzyme Gsa7p/Apg7p [Cladophialophora bantiana CBS 173.52]